MDRLIAARVFVTIAERGSMIAAAGQLDMSRAMVTRYLAQMEHWAGARLLHRTTRKLSLTDAGERTLALCRQMLAVAENIDLVADRQDDAIRGLLRISCSQSLGQTVLARAVTQYLQRYPAVAVDLQMNNQAVNLVEERIDLALRITNDLDPNLIARPLSTCASVVCATPAWLKKHGTPHHPDDLARHNCLTYSWFGKSLWHFDHQGTKSAVAVSGNLSANESVVLLAATLQDAGISLQPYYSVAPLLEKGELIELLPDYTPQAMGIYGIYLSRKQMPLTLRSMLDFLVEWFATDTRWQGMLRR
ncbi:LysR family transcriptional regulator [Enterobacter kobei]|uniref:LysR family transcriptional regulator n=2 Tax=Enterobacter kobei TaxID=208224 RepID=A0ACC8S9A8_9ENTR|nr:LysR family transcriptional regulator [Enterobacter kobei]OLR20114.1 LysR family transcriptional regulator [Enterobacter kobei]WNP33556.1 LysR family transcriptional regulator [Enterobacter kobei]BCU56632.1 LysR family transcriptional regulator [Enterobacter kobei]SIQ53912.1 transcriptional regulator, LysR family [Enterobacter kobei]